MGVSTAVVGASGYAGGELLRLLAAHEAVELTTLVGGSNAGRRVGDVHPHLGSLADRPLVSLDDADLAGTDLVFIALPHGASAAVATTLPESAVVVDLGADFRLE